MHSQRVMERQIHWRLNEKNNFIPPPWYKCGGGKRVKITTHFTETKKVFLVCSIPPFLCSRYYIFLMIFSARPSDNFEGSNFFNTIWLTILFECCLRFILEILILFFHPLRVFFCFFFQKYCRFVELIDLTIRT